MGLINGATRKLKHHSATAQPSSFMSSIAYGAALNSTTRNAQSVKKRLGKVTSTTAAFAATTHTSSTR